MDGMQFIFLYFIFQSSEFVVVLLQFVGGGIILLGCPPVWALGL